VDDFEIACMRLHKAKLRNKVLRVITADEMLEYLRSMDAYLDRDKFPLPAVIVLDQRLPDADGLEAQQMLKSSLRFRHIPVIAISSSDQILKLQSAVELGADGFMVKPFNADDFRRLTKELSLPIQFDTESHEVAQPIANA
jgi:CheY-like chemotaxis protein